MAITVDSRASGAQSFPSGANVTAATTMTWTHTLGAGSNTMLLAFVMQDAGGASTGVNWDSAGTNVAMAQEGTGAVTGTTRAEIWFLATPATTGAKSIKASWSGSHEACGGSASYFGVSGFNASSPQTATGSPTAVSLAVTSTSGEEVVNAFVQDLGTTGSAPTKGAGQTYICAGVNTNTTSIEGGASDQASAGASVTCTWTCASIGSWAQIGASLTVAGGGAAAAIYPPTLTLMGVQ